MTPTMLMTFTGNSHIAFYSSSFSLTALPGQVEFRKLIFHKSHLRCSCFWSVKTRLSSLERTQPLCVFPLFLLPYNGNPGIVELFLRPRCTSSLMLLGQNPVFSGSSQGVRGSPSKTEEVRVKTGWVAMGTVPGRREQCTWSWRLLSDPAWWRDGRWSFWFFPHWQPGVHKTLFKKRA